MWPCHFSKNPSVASLTFRLKSSKNVLHVRVFHILITFASQVLSLAILFSAARYSGQTYPPAMSLTMDFFVFLLNLCTYSSFSLNMSSYLDIWCFSLLQTIRKVFFTVFVTLLGFHTLSMNCHNIPSLILFSAN